MPYAPHRGIPRSMVAWSAARNYAFASAWNGRHYATKQIRPIFVEETDQIIVVTVYVCYF